jgi:hypothetical protein
MRRIWVRDPIPRPRPIIPTLSPAAPPPPPLPPVPAPQGIQLLVPNMNSLLINFFIFYFLFSLLLAKLHGRKKIIPLEMNNIGTMEGGRR